MSTYRVGGWVRDSLLGYEPKDHDFVVVGETKAQFEARWGPEYTVQQVGKSFPVFLVVHNKEEWKAEYAFARRERKNGLGHNGFEVEAGTDVSLHEDLFRRDLTCNAIALPHVHRNNPPLESQVIDPFGGVSDIKLGVLRHVSDHFVEDPLRVYRLARFAARFNWVIAPETYKLVKSIPHEEILALSGERVWIETERALNSPHPTRFFEELARFGVLGLWHTELAKLIGVPAGPPEHHGEGDAFTHTMMVLNYGINGQPDSNQVRFAALCHDLGKGVTPVEEWPSHHDHDQLGIPEVERFCERLHVPNSYRDCAVVACRDHMRVHKFLEMRKGKMVDLIKGADRCSMKAEGLALVSGFDSLGRIPSTSSEGSTALYWAAQAARAERGHPIPEALTGEHIGLHIRNKKGNAIRKTLKEKGMLP